ncbi:twin-arginine translocase subunit TatC [Vallicoccus soli]|uniref:Sec-independent protein translocase protein TatC n=1 Tax=Vallicoccus soli TaxID=2339232 RepID=A0A3A3ZDG5_9ACTN|nr:twin-arginine translocase subunit TatC [Vallicoccus soli]RJK93172.1 twin-arginine translocase subunit TatC [Vallicoccus soli]
MTDTTERSGLGTAPDPDDEGRMPLMEHLRELRRRLTRAVLAFAVVTVACFFFYSELFALIAGPFNTIKDQYAEQGATVTLNFQGIADPFSYALKICCLAGLFLSSPVWFYQLWAFINPGLHKNERRWGLAFVFSAAPLFIGGAVVAYVFLPKGFDLLIGFNPTPQDVANIIGFDRYLAFVTRMFIVFGVAFVLPVFVVALNLVQIVSARALLGAWRPVVLGSFVFAAVATPSGDPVTLCALALPMLVLYFIATGICFLLDRRRKHQLIDGVDYSELADDEAAPMPAPSREPRSRYDDDDLL